MNFIFPVLINRLLFGVKFFMDKNALMISEMNFMEVIHVELSNEGGDSVMSEIFGEYDFFQPFLIQNPDAFVLCVPVNDLGVLLGLDYQLITRRMLQSLPIKEAGLSSWFFIQCTIFIILPAFIGSIIFHIEKTQRRRKYCNNSKMMIVSSCLSFDIVCNIFNLF